MTYSALLLTPQGYARLYVDIRRDFMKREKKKGPPVAVSQDFPSGNCLHCERCMRFECTTAARILMELKEPGLVLFSNRDIIRMLSCWDMG